MSSAPAARRPIESPAHSFGLDRRAPRTVGLVVACVVAFAGFYVLGRAMSPGAQVIGANVPGVQAVRAGTDVPGQLSSAPAILQGTPAPVSRPSKPSAPAPRAAAAPASTPAVVAAPPVQESAPVTPAPTPAPQVAAPVSAPAPTHTSAPAASAPSGGASHGSSSGESGTSFDSSG